MTRPPLVALGLHSETAVAIGQFAPYYTKRSVHYQHSAFVRLWMEPARVKEILTAAGQQKGNCGATSVHGAFDGIVDVGARTTRALASRLDALLAIPGIVRADQLRVLTCAYRDRPRLARK